MLQRSFYVGIIMHHRVPSALNSLVPDSCNVCNDSTSWTHQQMLGAAHGLLFHQTLFPAFLILPASLASAMLITVHTTH